MSDATPIIQGPQQDPLSGLCPYCGMTLDVLLDIKARPYWRCGHCDLRTFASRSALAVLVQAGWIWAGPRPSARLRAALMKLATLLDLRARDDR